MSCKYCTTKKLEDIPYPWIFEKELSFVPLGDVQFGCYLQPQKSLMGFILSNQNCDEIIAEQVPIRFCPMCGRNLSDSPN